MKHLSFLLFNNLLGFNMKKGFKNFCTGDASTSTLNQHHTTTTTTLEDMIMQLDLEEKRAKLYDDEYDHLHLHHHHHRMSCVNSSDILRSARNALNHYPRFSLDGKDAMYRSSFRNLDQPSNLDARWIARDTCRLPAKVAGERVIWCKPGVVGKLMGLDAIPIPVRLNHRRINSRILRKQNLRRSSHRRELERRKLDSNAAGRCAVASCSKPATTTGYGVMNPAAVDIERVEVGWPMRRFL